MIHFACLNCGRKFQSKDEFAGRTTRCPSCKAPLEVPRPDRTEAYKPIARLVVSNDATAAGQRAEALASATVAHDSNGSDQPVADLIARDGQLRGRYVIDKEIARGGMGAVLRGIDRDIRREIAVKVMLDNANPQKKARFVEEAQITGQLEHPNIVPVHELGLDEQQRPFFTMKMVKGRSLDDIIKKLTSDPKAEHDWPLGRLLTILINVCHALSYAHSRHVIHRDLKPANIMVGDFGEVYVMDWGLAKVLAAPEPGDPMARPDQLIVATPVVATYVPPPPNAEASSASATATERVSTSRQGEADLTQDGEILGTPAFMSPEQALGRVPDIDQRTDVYALGALLYALMTLQPPVEKGGGHAGLLLRVAQGEIKKPEERAQGRIIPSELSAIAMKALAKMPADRYQTVEAFRRDLELYVEGRSVSAKHDTFREQVWKLVKRNKGASIATAAALVVLLVVAGFFLRVNYTARVQAENNYAAYQQEARKRRGSIPSFLTAGRLLMDKRDFEGAGAQVGLVLELEPEHAEGRLLRGQLAVIHQDFATARADLEAARQQRPNDPLVKDLLEVVSRFRANEEATALVLAETFTRHGEFALADGSVRAMGDNAPAAREKLLAMYRTRIDKAWPGQGSNLVWAPDGGLGFKVLGTTSDLSPLQGIPITTLRLRESKVRDLSPLKGMPLTTLDCHNTPVADLSPLRGMPLTTLHCDNTLVTDLSPLRGMPLTTLYCNNTPVKDLSPLQGMPLTTLHCNNSPVTDLSPLQGMPLTTLHCHNTHVTDLSPLQGMPLTSLVCNNTHVTDLSPLQGIPLTTLDIGLCKVRDLSPLKGMRLTALDCGGAMVADLSPLRGMPLTSLNFDGASVTDLSPLQGMPLTSLNFMGTKVADLSLLQGMPLTSINCSVTSVADLSPLKGMRLTWLKCDGTKVADLSPLRGMPIISLDCSGSKVADLSPLQGMPLITLISDMTSVTDLSPLKGMPLTSLHCVMTSVTDLSPLEGLKLTELHFTPNKITRGLDIVRSMPSLQTLGSDGNVRYPRGEFWARYDKGEFRK